MPEITKEPPTSSTGILPLLPRSSETRIRYGLEGQFDVPSGACSQYRSVISFVATLTCIILILFSITYAPIRETALQAFATTTANVGLQIDQIDIIGHQEISELDILQALGSVSQAPILTFDHNSPRVRLLSHPWVEDIVIEKVYPNQLRIEVKERTPMALWQLEKEVSLIDKTGVVITREVEERFAHLPQVAGLGANKRVGEITRLLKNFPVLNDLVRAAILISNRRWTLRLKSGTDILLPDNNPSDAVKRIMALNRDQQLLSRHIKIIDARFSDRLLLTPLHPGDAKTASTKTIETSL